MKKSVFVLSCLFLLGCSPKEKPFYDIVISDVEVIDLKDGALSRKTVFIKDGRIVKLQPEDSKESYTVETSIDGRGTFLLPGFWDNHVHFRGGDSLIAANKNFLKLFIANGITTVRDAGGDLTPSVIKWKKQIGQGKLVGPTIFTSGPKIDGPDPTWAGSLEVENETDIAKALDSLQQLKTDFVKLYDSRISGDMYLKTIKETEKRGLITSGHMPFTVELNQTIDAGIDAVEHLYYIMKGCAANESEITQKLVDKEIAFWQAMPLLLENYRDTTAQQTFRSLKENNVFVVPTLHIGKTLSYLDETDHTDDAYLKYMGQGIIKTYGGRIKRALNSSEKAIRDRKELDRFFVQLTKSLNDAGVKLLAGSDSGAYNSYTYPGISLHRELEAMVASGIPPLDALRASAYNGAEFLKQDSDYGSIAVGKVSDLVLLEDNPLEDITNTQQIHLVLKGNKMYSGQELRKLLDESIAD